MNAKKIKIYSKTKISTVSYQWENYGRSQYMHILERPQTINQNSEFSFDVAKTMVSAEFFLHKKGFWFTFIGCANDVILCDSKFLLSVLNYFIRGKIYTSHTDKNHNTKSSIYQMAIGGENRKKYWHLYH